MTRFATLPAIALGLSQLAACGVDTPDQGGQSGSLVPEMCIEVDRIAVSDPSAVQPEAGHSAQDVLDAQIGTFVGIWRGQDIAMSLALDGDIELVLIAPDPDAEDVGIGADPPGGMPQTMCPAFHWEIPVIMAITSLPELDETVHTTLVARGPDEGSVGATLDVSEVDGTLEPGWNPDDWDHTSLDIGASYSSGLWRGGLFWSSSNEPDANGMASGMVDPVDEFTMVAP
ncbi:MAG: hypothetical protein H6737_30590 [Alphaproteobacteria bacterium]|nr:hypothetical protein [Alphaproteobacteria bacterium]